MVMKNVKSAHFWQIDHKTKNILDVKGIIILPSPEAWEKFKWSRKWFNKKPKEGYFIWVKKQVDFPLFTCVSIASKKIHQELQNLLILEKNLNIEIQGVCNTLSKNLCGIHKAQGKIILKEGSTLKYKHIHSWSREDIVEPDYKFLLEKNSKLDYNYENLFTSKKLKIVSSFDVFAGASCNVKIVVNCTQTETEIKDTLRLVEKGASGIVKLRLVGEKGSNISAYSQILAEAESKGHLDCQGLMVDKDSVISLDPKLICKNKLAQLTHEASIGRISGEQLSYLRMRGFSEKQAIDLIINGFLKA